MPPSGNNKPVLSSFTVENLGPVEHFSANHLGMINIFLGENSAGKTYMMKMLYVACKVMETYKKGQDNNSLAALMSEKVRWTYQTPTLAHIVKRRSSGGMRFSCKTQAGDQMNISISNKGMLRADERVEPFSRARIKSNSIFLPAKEVLTSFGVIVTSREDDREFGFDDTYYDLARILLRPPKQGKNYASMAKARGLINEIIGAKAVYDNGKKRWMISKGRDELEVSEASEGVKKLSIMDILLGNRYIGPGSVVFIDEPESALHPQAISAFMEAIYQMSLGGIQFIMSTHSYFVIRKLANIAARSQVDIPVFSYQSENQKLPPDWVEENMKDGLPDNPIVRESVKLYKEDLKRWI